MPQTNISDEERNIINTSSFMVKLLHICLDILGPHFVFNNEFSQLLNQAVNWLIHT